VGGVERPRIVHRLDRGTSGVMVVAKHDVAHRALARQFHDREVRKEYIALVWGRIAGGRTIEAPIGRHPRERRRMSTRARRARPAVTHVEDARPVAGGRLTLVRLVIGTGRTHQIRVHLSAEGHPVVGDATYGGVRRAATRDLAAVARLDRPFLHAASLTLRHPRTGGAMTFSSALPSDLAEVLAALGGGSNPPGLLR
jgi:23S rRNA pseudouridine1911/1915/1917 synthase